MNKQEAATFLKISEKTLDRAVKKGDISARYENTKAGRSVIFDDDELKNYKAKRETGVLFPALMPAEPQAMISTTVGQVDGQPLLSALTGFAEAQKLAAISHKLTLSLDEAAQLSGLSKASLKTAIKAGTMKTFQGQRGSKNIRRADLDRFIESL
jgi:predicted site-specific integrase-resolvase